MTPTLEAAIDDVEEFIVTLRDQNAYAGVGVIRKALLDLVEAVQREMREDELPVSPGAVIDEAVRLHEEEQKALRERVEELERDRDRLRRRTHEIADDGNRRVAEVQKAMTRDLIHARLDTEGRERVREYLAARGVDPSTQLPSGLLPYSVSHETSLAINELLRALDERSADLSRLRDLADRMSDYRCDRPGECGSPPCMAATEYRAWRDAGKEAKP